VTSFIHSLVTNQGPNDQDTFSMMHILNHNFNKHGYSKDNTRVSNIISKYLQIKETPIMNTTFNNFSYLFYIEDQDIQTDQPFINLSGFIQQISQIPINQ
jgi:hypothetical protein